MTDVTAQLQDRVGVAVATEFATATGEFLSRWVLLAEVIDTNGDRAVWMLSADEQQSWETLGLIRLADHLEAAACIKDALDGEEGR